MPYYYHRLILVVSIVLFHNISCSAQIDAIELPKGSSNLDFELDTPHYSFYVTKNEELYFEDLKLSQWNQVSSKIVMTEMGPTGKRVQHIIIYADKSISHRFVQRLRSEIAKVWSGFIHYKAGGSKDDFGVSIFIAGSENDANRLDDAGDYYFSSKFIYSTTNEEGTFDDMPSTPPLFPIPAIWQNNFSRDLYRLSEKHIEQTLGSINYQSISVLSNSRFVVDKVNYSFGNSEVLERLVKSSDLFLVKFDVDLNYNDYYKALDSIQVLRVFAPESIHGVLKKPYAIEVTYELENALMGIGFDFFNP